MGKIVVLMYNLNNDKGKKIEQFSRSMGISTLSVIKEDYNKPIENLLSGKAEEAEITPVSSTEPFNVEDKATTIEGVVSEVSCDLTFEDEMLVMCGFNSRLLDIFLREYKKRKLAPVSLKAILTEYNIKLSSFQLHAELCRERATFTKE